MSAAALVLSMAVAVLAQTPAQKASTLSGNLMSPFCPGLLLADCQSGRAYELRAEIARRFEAGETAPAIEADLLARFGTVIRATPELRGIGILAWAGPALLAAAALAFVVVVIRGATRRLPAARRRAEDLAGSGDPAMLERLRIELEALD